MHTLMLVVGTIFFAALLILTPWIWFRREPTHRPKPGRFKALMDFVESPSSAAIAEFWNASGRIKGINERLVDATLIVRQLQHRVHVGEISHEDAAEVYSMVAAQAWSSVVAYLEAGLCSLRPELPHTAARVALQIHWQLSLRAQNLCLDSENSDSRLFL